MPKGKKSSTVKKPTAKSASKSVTEPVQKKAAEPKAESVKPAAQAKKATAAKKAAAAKSPAKTAKKAAPKNAKKPTSAKAKATVASAAKKATKTVGNKRTVAKTTKVKTDEVVFQSGDKNYTLPEIAEICKNTYRGGTRKQIKSIKVYVKAEGDRLKAYYVVNDSISGSVDL